MTTRARIGWEASAAAVTVAVLAAAGGNGPYPVWVDLMVYAAAASMAVYLTVRALDWRAHRQQETDPADRADVQTREEALREAADWTITARPEDDYAGRSLTPAAVRREALMRSGLDFTEQEAADMLAARLRHRGYA